MDGKFPAPKQKFILGTSVTAVSTGSGNIARQPEETFDQWLRKNVREYPVTLDLPDALWPWIAQIISYWSVAEWMELGILARLMKSDRKEMRVFLGATRTGGGAGKINELIKSKDIKVSINMADLTTTLNECERARNLLGHGVWLIDPVTDELCIENPSGEWIQPKEQSVSRRKYPQAFHPTVPWFICTLSDIKTVIRELQRLDQEIASALAASPQKAG